MSILQFSKYQGTGNDFIFIDNRKQIFDKQDLSLIKRLCHRKFGIGADGVVLLENHPNTDFYMVYFNPDGSQSFCGNASRCAVKFAERLNLIKDKATFLATDGVHEAFIEDDLIHLKMNDVTQVSIFDQNYFIDTGSPHYISFVETLKNYDVCGEGRKIRYSEPFQESGTNVNFVQLEKNNEISVRTYERGVEDETLSCGTGVTAAALAVSLKQYKSPVRIKTPGGNLLISFEKSANHSFQNIYLIGPAELVFEGSIKV